MKDAVVNAVINEWTVEDSMRLLVLHDVPPSGMSYCDWFITKFLIVMTDTASQLGFHMHPSLT